jgi:hypothetical protein
VVAVDGSYTANGILEEDEPGISDVIVRLGEGECPAISSGGQTTVGSSSTIIAATTTDENGHFVFAAIPPGAYCLMINTLDEPNRDILLPGNWTGDNLGNRTITLAAGETTNEVNFGWDFTFQPISAAALNCEDSADFVEDITVPDESVIAAGAPFTKTWRIRNNGSCTWTPAYALTFVDGTELDGPTIVPITRTIVPSDTVDLSVQLTAPTYNDTFRSDWYLYNGYKREFFGILGDAPIWVIIVVEDAETPDISGTLTPVTGTAPITDPTITTTPVPTQPGFVNAALSGLVWHDVCEVVDEEPSANCVADGSDGYRANGVIDEEERFLRSVTVSLYQNECPARGRVLATAVTNIGGGYVFTNLAPGPYCVTIDVFTPENVSLLAPGDWTYPEPGVGRTTIVLESGENLTEINFGWDFE